MCQIYRSAPYILAALLLAACGGGGGGVGDARGGSAPPRRALLQRPPPPLFTVTAPNLLLELNLAANLQLLALSGVPHCDILLYHIEYTTVGGANEATTAS